MRIASYNIMSGGFDSYTYDAASPQRLPAIQRAIKQLDADIIGLIDTFRWHEIYTETDLKKLFGYKHAFCINLNDERLKKLGHNNGITLLSNVAIVEQHIIRIATRDAMSVRVNNNGSLLTLIIVYLDDMEEDARLKQLQELKSFVDLNEPLIIMGDMNTIKQSDVTATKASLEQFYLDNPALTKLEPILNDMLRGETIALLESWGLHDAGQAQQQPTVPTPLFPAKTNQPFLRLDYCFHSPPLSVSDFKIPYEKPFQEASDHFPIVFEI